jgi:hypothetical protein
MLLAAGCHESNMVATPDLQLPNAGMTYNANVQRLQLASSTRVATLSGTITITGFTVLDSAGKPVAPATAVTKVMARLLDPEDDILRTTYPGTTGSYRLDYDKSLSQGKLRLTVRVQEDLNGDGTGGDTLDLRFPVSLVLGRVCKLNVTLAPASKTFIGLLPAGGGIVLSARIDQLDANGANTAQSGTFFATGRVVIDQDKDGTLELGDDFSAPDTNRDGWADSSEAAYSGATPIVGGAGVPFETLNGQVRAVDLAAYTLTVRDSTSGADRLVLYDPLLCSIEPYIPVTPEPPLGAEPGGSEPMPGYDYFPPVPLDSSLVGRMVIINGFTTDAGFQATQIVVLDTY